MSYYERVNTINLNGDHFVLDLRDRGPVKAIGEWTGWRRQLGGVYTAPTWVSSVLGVDLRVPGLELQWSPEAARKRDQLIALLEVAKKQLAKKQLIEPTHYPTKRTPFNHQAQAVNAAGLMSWCCIIADEMGLGKTASALWAWEQVDCCAVIVCPVSVKFNWKHEVHATIGSTMKVGVIDGTKKQRANTFSELDHYRVIVINYDLLRSLEPSQMKQLQEWIDGGMLIADESHYLKNKEAQRSQATRTLRLCAKFCILLTGTPVRDTNEDWFNQLDMARPGIFRSYAYFDSRYLVRRVVEFGKRQVRKVVATQNTDELNAIINTMVIRRRKEDVLDLPPKMHTYPTLTLDQTTQKLYSAMKDFAKVEIETLLAVQGEATGGMFSMNDTIFHPRARSAVEALMRLEQIAQGFIGGIPEQVMEKVVPYLKRAEKIPGRPHDLIFPHSSKIRWLVETIENIRTQGGAPLVFSRFNAPMIWLREHLIAAGHRVGFLHGGLSAEQKSQLVNEFRDSYIDVLLCQVKIAEGWNATRSQDVIFYGRDWSPAINHQAEDRAHRIGQKGTVNVQIPIVNKTVEVSIDRRLNAKHADAEASMGNLTLQEMMEIL